MKISRRKFIASVGGAAAGAAAFGGFAQTPQDTKNILKAWALQQEQWSPSICQQCPGGCGMLVRVVDGEVVQLAGNPLHPINRGGLCMKGVSSTQVLYDPDRIKSPLAREGNRGEGKWKAISWDEALQKLTANLSQLRSEGKAHTVGLLGGQYRGLRDEIFQRFCEAYGTPNYMRLRSMKPEQEQSTFRFMQGHDRPLTYDLQNSRFVLSFGVNLLEGWSSPVSQQLAHGKQRAGDMGQRGKLAQVDPRYSVTAAKADYWLPVKPGTDAALALGLANVIIQESLEDREFIRDKTYGYDDFKTPDGKVHMGFKRMVLENYHPEEVSRITGIPVEKIFQVARAFARSRPAVAIGERGPSFHANDFYTRMAIHSLNALVGAIGIKGGVVVQGKVPLAPWAQLELDDAAQAGLAKGRIDQSSDNDYLATDSPAKKLLENIEKGSPYQLSTLLVYHTNP
ncbi:MAG: molybdopterin-dependent oxidoreductase, partial [Deltaproteobacteria bacterium]|nr:molybdopterin-dependent oxidoreductase [Deltaproteobacteria bacterium]